jgi:phosphoribosylaminoimidazolecarboxamide formyltransferase/IMP cyclohydrolase
MLFAFTVAKHVKSNAIVYAKDGRTAGVGAGQMNRRDSARIAALRAARPPRPPACLRAWPGVRPARRTPSSPSPTACCRRWRPGATAVIQPGGSIRDEEVIAAADEAGVAMAFTGVRVFRH